MSDSNGSLQRGVGWAGPRNSRKVGGRALVWVLLLLFLGYGINALYFKPKIFPQAQADGAQASPPKKADVVIFYTTSSCEPCDRARTWMTQRKVRFEERNVEKWPPYQRELESYAGRIVPVLIVNGEAQHGFYSAYLDAALRGESTGSK